MLPLPNREAPRRSQPGYGADGVSQGTSTITQRVGGCTYIRRFCMQEPAGFKLAYIQSSATDRKASAAAAQGSSVAQKITAEELR